MAFTRAQVGWTLAVDAPTGVPEQAIAWLRALGATLLVRDPRRTTAVRAQLRQLPAPCAHIMLTCDLQAITLTPGGKATLQVRGKDTAIRQLVADLDVAPTVAVPLLTARQAELLSFCVKHGYYDVPRRATLRELGKRLGISAPSLSLALRRAEAKLVIAFAANLPTATTPPEP